MKKCNWCEEKTEVIIHNLADIDWSACQFNDEEKIYACPKHQEEMSEFMIRRVKEKK
jgi:hypothetical protein